MRLRICSGVVDGFLLTLQDVHLDLESWRARLCDCQVQIQLGSGSPDVQELKMNLDASVVQLANQLEPTVWLKSAVFDEIFVEQMQSQVFTSSCGAALSLDEQLTSDLVLNLDLFSLSSESLKLAAELFRNRTHCTNAAVPPLPVKKESRIFVAMARQLGNVLVQLLHRLLLPAASLTPARHLPALELLAKSVETALSTANLRLDTLAKETNQIKVYAACRLNRWAKKLAANKGITVECSALDEACVAAGQLLAREFDFEIKRIRNELSTSQGNLVVTRTLLAEDKIREASLCEERTRILEDLQNMLMAREMLLQQLLLVGSKHARAELQLNQHPSSDSWHLIPSPTSSEWLSYLNTLDKLSALRRLRLKAFHHKMQLCTLRNICHQSLVELRSGRRTSGEFVQQEDTCWWFTGFGDESAIFLDSNRGENGFGLQWQRYQKHVEDALRVDGSELAHLHSLGVMHLKEEIERFCVLLQDKICSSDLSHLFPNFLVLSVGLSEADYLEMKSMDSNSQAISDQWRENFGVKFKEHMNSMLQMFLASFRDDDKTSLFHHHQQQLWLSYDKQLQFALGKSIKRFYAQLLREEINLLGHAHKLLNLVALGISESSFLCLEKHCATNDCQDLEMAAWFLRLSAAVEPSVTLAADPCVAVHQRLASLFEAEMNLADAVATQTKISAQSVCADTFMDYILVWLLVLAPAQLRADLYLSLAAIVNMQPEWLERGPYACVLVHWDAVYQLMLCEMRRLVKNANFTVELSSSVC